MTFKNMKIEINEQQPLDEVVGELEKLGYVFDTSTLMTIELILTWDFGSYDKVHVSDWSDFHDHFPSDEWIPTTLAELKEMKQ